jgi:HEAT repeat protein
MKLIPTTLAALLLAQFFISGAQAQTTRNPERPVPPVRPVQPMQPERPNSPGNEQPPNDDEQLAIAALEGLMTQPSERALPILKKVLAGSQPTVVKRRALFVLAQIGAPEAHKILLQTARDPNAELRRDAIRSIGISGDTGSLDALQEIYPASDAQTKKDILQAWMIAGRKQAVYQVAVNAKTEDEASEAIRMLGVMGAHEELRKLGDQNKAPHGLLEAYAISGDLAGLRKIAEGTGEKSLRVDAVRRIGIIHSDAARAALRDIYTKNTDEEMKKAALQGMLISQDDQGVLALYRAAKTTDEKKQLLRTLSMMNSDAALEAIDATLEKKP